MSSYEKYALNEWEMKKVGFTASEEVAEKVADAAAAGYEAIETGAVDTYKAIESAVVGGYQKAEGTFVGGFNKIADGFVDRFLKRDGESVEEARARLEKR